MATRLTRDVLQNCVEEGLRERGERNTRRRRERERAEERKRESREREEEGGPYGGGRVSPTDRSRDRRARQNLNRRRDR